MVPLTGSSVFVYTASVPATIELAIARIKAHVINNFFIIYLVPFNIVKLKAYIS
jgi:hypothetical protein